MSIIFISVGNAGQDGQYPRRNQMVSSDSLSVITTAGYLNRSNTSGYQIFPTDVWDVIYSYTPASGFQSASAFGTGTYASFTTSISGGVITLVPYVSAGNVLLPVVSGDFAVFNGTTGQIKDAGYLPSNAAKTVVVMANAAVTTNALAVYADTAGTLKNASTTATIGFGITAATGNLVATSGNITAGSSGNAGVVTSFPGTAANGSLIVAAVNAGGAFNTTISNGTMGQSTVYTMGDIGATTGGIVVATSAIRMKSVAQAAVAGGNASQTITDTFCTSTSNVIANWNDTTNAVEIKTVAAGNGSFVVVSTADPGASHINYIITK